MGKLRSIGPTDEPGRARDGSLAQLRRAVDGAEQPSGGLQLAGLDAEQRAEHLERIRRYAAVWGTQDSPVVDGFAPSLAADQTFRTWHQRYERLAASSDSMRDLLIQMLDKLVDNAVDFSTAGDTVAIELTGDVDTLSVSVTNPGPPLPERMRSQLFDSMVSMREGKDSRHLGLGLYVAKLIAEGHGGSITADNIDGGVIFAVSIPRRVGS